MANKDKGNVIKLVGLRRVAKIGASLDVVVRSDPEVCGLSGSGYHITLHHSGYGDCTVGDLTLIDCPNELVLTEFERWMRGAGHETMT